VRYLSFQLDGYPVVEPLTPIQESGLLRNKERFKLVSRRDERFCRIYIVSRQIFLIVLAVTPIRYIIDISSTLEDGMLNVRLL